MKIAFFDSGIGGLTVLHEALGQIPHEDFVYYADSGNLPYGTKSMSQIRSHVIEATRFIARMKIKALVVACNTATSAAIQDIRREYDFPIIGMEPAVKPAIRSVRDKRVLVFATALTLREAKFSELLKGCDTDQIVDVLPLQELVTFAEEYQFDEEVIASYLRSKLRDHDLSEYGAVVLGCTHFIYFENHIRAVLPPGTALIHGNKGTVQNLKRTLMSKGTISDGSGHVEFYRSGERVLDPSEMERYFALLTAASSSDKPKFFHGKTP